MKEVTVCYKAEVTKVVNIDDESELMSSTEMEENVKKQLDADDVHVSKMKCFIFDEEDARN
jgi:hypothetical protein